MSQSLPAVRSRSRPRFTTHAADAPAPGVRITYQCVAIGELPAPNRQLRRRARKLLEKNGACIDATSFNPPVTIDRGSGRILQGEGHLETYRLLKRPTVPVLWVDGLSAVEADAVQLWLAGFDASGELDDHVVRQRLENILEIDPDLLASVFFDPGQIDLFLLADTPDDPEADEEVVEAEATIPVTQFGDRWVWTSGHRAICGNSRLPETYTSLMAGETAKLLATDPPFGTAVANISSQHAEWVEGSGMTEAETTDFLSQFLQAAVTHLAPGALVYSFIDAKGMISLLSAIRAGGLHQKQICAWDKGSGLGGHYMNVLEWVVIAKHGKAKHLFNPEAGFNTTLWSVPGYASFRPDRDEALANHACTKPQGVLMPILLAASKVRDIVLDPFLGSGSMMVAAERTKRRCYGIEIDPKFVDTTVRRMFALTGEYPMHEATGLRFDEIAAERGVPLPGDPASAEVEL